MVEAFKVKIDHPDLSKPIWLHQDKKKFWEIKITQLNTVIRVGRLLDIETEMPDPQTVVKDHNSKDEMIQYIEKHVNTKLSRGYKFETADDHEPEVQKKNQNNNKNNNNNSFQILVSSPKRQDNDSDQDSPVLNQSKGRNLFLNAKKSDDEQSNSSRKSSLADLTDISVRSKSPSQSNREENSNLGASRNGAIKVLLAQKWESDNINPKGYLMSEKLDGLRMFWDGTHMWSRNGNRFYCPKWFTENWPKSQLDGELWTKRGDFQSCISYVKKHQPIDEQWQKVKYLVYDAPGINKPFKDRYKIMDQEIPNIDNEHIILHKHIICDSLEDLEEELKQVLDRNGEGLMLRDPDSKYQNKRSKTLLKVKVMNDEEATVIGHEAGSGRCSGMLGALLCQNNTCTFKIGSGFNDQQRKHPPKIGTVVTYKFQNLSNSGKPRFPIFLRIKEDE